MWEYKKVTEQNIEELTAAAELFKALGSPVRLAIVRLLTTQPATVTELVRELGVSQPLVSQHLKLLRQLKLVTATRQGQHQTYRLADEHVSHIVGDAIEHTKEQP